MAESSVHIKTLIKNAKKSWLFRVCVERGGGGYAARNRQQNRLADTKAFWPGSDHSVSVSQTGLESARAVQPGVASATCRIVCFTELCKWADADLAGIVDVAKYLDEAS